MDTLLTTGHRSPTVGPNETATPGYLDNLTYAIPLGIVLISLSLLTFLGNAMVVHAIRTERKLRTVSNMFILSLAVADLIVGLTVMPISSAYVLTGDWVFGIIVCQLWLVIDYTASTASIFNLLILSLDRYWSIRSPLKYLCKRTKKRALAMIGLVWFLSASWIIPIIGWHEWYNEGDRKHPSNVCETEFSDNIVFKLTTSALNFFIPMTLMIIIYYKIYREIKRRGKFDIGRCTSGKLVSQKKHGKTKDSFRISSGHSTPKFKSNPFTWTGQWFSLRQTEIGKSGSRKGGTGEQKIPGNETDETSVDADTFQEQSCCGPASLDDSLEESDGNVKRYQKLTLVKPDKSSYALEDFKDIEVKVRYVNGGSQGRLSEHLVDKQETTTITTTTTIMTTTMSKALGCSLNRLKVMEDKEDEGEEVPRKDKSSLSKPKRTLPTGQNLCLATGRSSTNLLSPSVVKVEGGSNLKSSRSMIFLDRKFHCGSPDLRVRQTSSSSFRNPKSHHHQVLRRVESSRLRQEKKAALQLGVILGAFTVCWLPYVIVFIVTAYCSCISHSVHTIVIWLGYFNSTVNPFLYALCNDNFKNAFRKLLGRGPQHNTFETVTHGTSFKHSNQCFS